MRLALSKPAAATASTEQSQGGVCGGSAWCWAVLPWAVCSEHRQAAAEGRWMRSKGQPEEAGARCCPDALAAGLKYWGGKGQKDVVTQPAHLVLASHCGGAGAAGMLRGASSCHRREGSPHLRPIPSGTSATVLPIQHGWRFTGVLRMPRGRLTPPIAAGSSALTPSELLMVRRR